MRDSESRLKQRVKDLFIKFFSGLGTFNLRGRIARGAVGTFCLKIIATGLTFIVSILLARLLGSTGYGSYSYAMAWVGLLGVPAGLGLEKLLVRNVAAYQVNSAWGLMLGLLKRASQIALFVSLLIVLVMVIWIWAFGDHLVPDVRASLFVALPLLPIMASTRVRQATLQGLHRVVIGQLPETVVGPLLFISFLGISVLIFRNHVNASLAIGLNVISGICALIMGTQILRRALPKIVKEVSPVYETRAWIRSALPLLFINVVHMINLRSNVIMLGTMCGTKEVGIYAVASQGAELITFVLVAFNAVLAPTISSLYVSGDKTRLQSVITKCSRIALSFSFPVALSLIVLRGPFLAIFGPDFEQGSTALVILGIGQFVSAAMGSVGLLLVMTGHEDDAALGAAISAVVNLGLNALLIPHWGIEGAACAKAGSLILFNAFMALLVYRRIGIESTVLGAAIFRKWFR